MTSQPPPDPYGQPQQPDPYGQQPQQPDPYGPSSPPPGQSPYEQPGQPPGYPPPGPPGYPPQPPGPPPGGNTNTLAIVSLVLALAGLVTLGITAVVGAILGHVAKRQIRDRDEQGEGLATAGIIAGWVIAGLWLLLGCCLVILVVANADS